MKKSILLLLVLLISPLLRADSLEVKRIHFEVGMPLNFGIGLFMNPNAGASDHYMADALVSSSKPIIIRFTVFNFATYLNKKYGFNVGLNYHASGIVSSEMVDKIKMHDTDHYYYFNPKWSGGGSLGTITNINLCFGFSYAFAMKKFRIEPFAQYQFGSSSAPKLEVERKPKGSNNFTVYDVTTRKLKNSGLEAGVKVGTNAKNDKTISGLFITLTFGTFTSKGNATVIEKPLGNLIGSTTTNHAVSKSTNYLSLGAIIMLGRNLPKSASVSE